MFYIVLAIILIIIVVSIFCACKVASKSDEELEKIVLEKSKNDGK